MTQAKGQENYRLWGTFKAGVEASGNWADYINDAADGLSHAKMYATMGKSRRSSFIRQNTGITTEVLEIETVLRATGLIGENARVVDDGAKRRAELAVSGHGKNLESSLMSSLNRIKALEQENRVLHDELTRRNIIFDLLANGRVPR